MPGEEFKINCPGWVGGIRELCINSECPIARMKKCMWNKMFNGNNVSHVVDSVPGKMDGGKPKNG